MAAALGCDSAGAASSLPHFWEHTVGSGHATLALREAQMRRANDELGFAQVRFHGLLCDDMGTPIGEGDTLFYSFFNADQIFDFLLSIGMKPFVELSFVPTMLASGDQTVFHYCANVARPKDYGQWTTLIRKLVAHWVERYGLAGIRQWFFEVWNEPNPDAFGSGKQDDYFQLYRHTVEAIKWVDRALRVGGPATAANAWIDEFIGFCAKSRLLADFISTHHYPTDAFGQPGDDTEAQLSKSRRSVPRDETREVRRQAGDRPVFYTEWCTSSNPRHPIVTETVQVRLANAPPPVQATIPRIDADHANAKERDAAQILSDALAHDGVEIHLNTEVVAVRVAAKQKIVDLVCDDYKFSVSVDEILAGIGRAPNVEGLNLEAAGVRYDTVTGICVNDFLQTGNPRIYAVGDVCLEHKFSHAAVASARIAVRNALFFGRKRLSALTIPWCTYTDPEIVHVGLYVREAQEKAISVKTFTILMHDVDRAVTDGEAEGFVKIHVKEGTDRILGATIFAQHAGEMINGISLAINSKMGLRALARVIHTYPTQAEAIKMAADAYTRTRLTPVLKSLSAWWLAR